jgi:hypothetical protein
MQTKMRISGAVTIRDIAGIIAETAMLIPVAVLFTRFILNSSINRLRFDTVNGHFILRCVYAPKRIVNPNIHDRKFALFPCGAEHGRFT